MPTAARTPTNTLRSGRSIPRGCTDSRDATCTSATFPTEPGPHAVAFPLPRAPVSSSALVPSHVSPPAAGSVDMMALAIGGLGTTLGVGSPRLTVVLVPAALRPHHEQRAG